MTYFTALEQARKLWVSGAPSMRIIGALTRQFPNIPPSQIEDDFFDEMGAYPDPINEEGDGIYE